MAVDLSQFKDFASLQAAMDEQHAKYMQSQDPLGQGGPDGYDPNTFAAMIGGQTYSAKYDGNNLQSLQQGAYEDPYNSFLNKNSDGSIGEQRFTPDTKAESMQFLLTMLAAAALPIAGGALGGVGAAEMGGAGAAGVGADAAATAGAAGAAGAAGGLGTAGAGAGLLGQAAETIPQMLITGAAPAAGATAGQIATGLAGAAGTTAAASGGGNVADYSNEGYGYTNPASTANSPINASTAGGASGSSLSSLLSSGKSIAGLAGGLLGGVSSLTSPSSLTSTSQQTLDPRMQTLLYGDGTATNPGLLNKITTAGGAAQTAGTAAFGSGMDGYLKNNGMNDFYAAQQAAQKLENSNIAAPTMQAAQATSTPAMQAAQINAPAQNGVDTASAYNSMINGNAGANPYLTSALQSAVDQTNASYQQNQTSLSNNLQRTILPGINSSAQLSGQYGGTRQGIAQGNALSDYSAQLNNSNLQLGLANSANTTGQQATAYNAGQDRSLSAMNALSANQYGTATNNANLQQQANAANYAGQQATNLANAGYQSTANQSNLQAGLSTNALNSANQATGVNASSGLLNTANTDGLANNNYTLNRDGATAGLLSPFTGLGSTTTATQPLTSNTTGSIAGGALTGLGLYNAYNKLTS